MPLDTWPPPPWEEALDPPGPWRPETPGDPWTPTGEPLGEARVWPSPEGGGVAAMLYLVEGCGYTWWTWGPFWPPDDGAWLADYVARTGGGQ